MFFTKSWVRTRFNIAKLLGISAATALTLRLIYTELPFYVSKADSSSISQSLTRDSLVNNEKLVSVILITRHGTNIFTFSYLFCAIIKINYHI